MHIIPETVKILQQGGVIAYPTEAVYGLGCDPFNQAAVNRLLALKKRSWEKGLILIAASWEQIVDYVEPIPTPRMDAVLATWPGPITWIFPATTRVPEWIRGRHDSIAIRVTAHPLAQALCAAFGKPLVSTSANLEGQPPARFPEEVAKIFPDSLDLIVEGALGDSLKPTEIREARTGKVLRAG